MGTKESNARGDLMVHIGSNHQIRLFLSLLGIFCSLAQVLSLE